MLIHPRGGTVSLGVERYSSKLKKGLVRATQKREGEIIVAKGNYIQYLPARTLSIITKTIEEIPEESLESCILGIIGKVEELRVDYSDDIDVFTQESVEATTRLLNLSFVQKLLDNFEKELAPNDYDKLYQVENEISSSLMIDTADEYEGALGEFWKDGEVEFLKEAFSQIFVLKHIKGKIQGYFNEFEKKDFVSDLWGLEKNRRLVEKTELYLYLFEISYEKSKFPIFYKPVTVEPDSSGANSLKIKLDSRLFLNTKAIDYIVQENNKQLQTTGTLAADLGDKRILYGKDANIENIQSVIDTICSHFGQDSIDFTKSDKIKREGLNVSITNEFNFWLFDKSDEALINDYEEILAEDSSLKGAFDDLLSKFIQEDPLSVIDTVQGEWVETPNSKKISPSSPLPLNEEQKQILKALRKKDCSTVIVEGPPGTGKSHTIVGILCDYILNNKSVLVLSDKKEALDVVEDKLTETLSKVRFSGRESPNPILRLGKAGNTFSSLFQQSAIDSLREDKFLYLRTEEDLEKELKAKTRHVANDFNKEVKALSEISVQEIAGFFRDDERHGSCNWLPEKNTEEQAVKLLRLHSILKDLSGFEVKSGLKAQHLEGGGIDLIEVIEGVILERDEGIKALEGTGFPMTTLFAGRNEDYQSLSDNLRRFQRLRSSGEYEILSDEVPEEDFSSWMSYLEENPSFSLLIDEAFNWAKELDIRVLQTGDRKVKTAILESLQINNSSIPLVDVIDTLEDISDELLSIRKPVIGYLFQRRKIDDLRLELQGFFPYFDFPKIESYSNELSRIAKSLKAIAENASNLAIQDLKKTNAVNLALKCLGNSFTPSALKNLSSEIELTHTELISSGQINLLENFLRPITSIETSKQIEIFDEARDTVIAEEAIIDWFNDPETQGLFVLGDIEKAKNQFLEERKAKKGVKTCIEAFGVARTELEEAQKMPYIELKELLEDKKNQRWLQGVDLNVETDDYLRNWDFSGEFSSASKAKVESYVSHGKQSRELIGKFSKLSQSSFLSDTEAVEENIARKMKNTLGSRLLNYHDHFASQAQTLKGIIRKKEKFPKDLFAELKNAFPCIVAGIRDYADYIPLEEDLFDLIVIDEASQVSIAQALPALIRGKKVVVLGDDRQFSNVKSANASSAVNAEFKSSVIDDFEKDILSGQEDSMGWMSKVKDNFDIKNSILRFSRFITNYQCFLKKHFRCYPEIISYSDEFFYGNSLQCMKIRSKPIDEVIKIKVIEHDGKKEPVKNTNYLEAEYIKEELEKVVKEKREETIGIITPHTQQMRFLYEVLDDLQGKDWLYGKCKLKIMTFDTCQGEERDIIFYSMVANKEEDKLRYIFPAQSIRGLTSENESNKKMQRLNVGFSRAKECMHFVLSKPTKEFSGSIKEALLHYEEQRNSAMIPPDDSLCESPMEKKVLEWIQQTDFYKQRRSEGIEIRPNYPIGKHLAYLDKSYSHPGYRVDFMVSIPQPRMQIVVEYDGFKEHFENLDEVHEGNYHMYMKESDLYRQRILEGYGFHFIRMNKFNLKEGGAEFLDERFREILKKKVALLRPA